MFNEINNSIKPFLEMTGYKPLTTFWQDFGIAERFGESAMLDTYKKCFDYAKDDYKILTELVIMLNWKMWEQDDKGNPTLGNIYCKLWEKADNYALDNLKDEELQYFIRTID